MNLPENVIIQHSNGKWGFVGNVRCDLAYASKDGKPLTDKQIDTIRHCGPGFAKVKSRTFETKEEALAAL